tara:strand:+ start:9669 stop:10415 length:747 start_codon:yes stop_codon:yes gene_type:complete
VQFLSGPDQVFQEKEMIMKTISGTSIPYMAAAAIGLAVLGWSQMDEQHSASIQDFARTPSFTNSPPAVATQQRQVAETDPQASARISNDINQLREHMATLVEHQSLTQEELDDLRDSINRGEAVAETAKLSPATPEEEATMLESQFSRMDAYLGHETPDPDWSGETRGDVERSMELAELSGATLLESTCGTTLCKVKINLPADRAPEESLQRLAAQRSWDGATMFKLSGNGEADFYIARLGHELPTGE